MALKIDSEFHGIEVKGAYCSIANLGFGPDDKTKVLFSLYYRSEKGSEPFRSESFSAEYDMDGSNPFTQAYDYLKSLPELEGAADC